MNTYAHCLTIKLDLKDAASLIMDIAILRKANYEIDRKDSFDTSLPTLYDNEQMKESSGIPEVGVTKMNNNNAITETTNNSPNHPQANTTLMIEISKSRELTKHRL